MDYLQIISGQFQKYVYKEYSNFTRCRLRGSYAVGMWTQKEQLQDITSEQETGVELEEETGKFMKDVSMPVSILVQGYE